MSELNIKMGNLLWETRLDPQANAAFDRALIERGKLAEEILNKPGAGARSSKRAVNELDESIKDLTDRVRGNRSAYVAGLITAKDFTETIEIQNREMRELIETGKLSNAQLAKVTGAYATNARAIDTLEGRASKLGIAQQFQIGLQGRIVNSLQSFGPAGAIAGGGLGLVANGITRLTTGSVGFNLSFTQMMGLLKALPAIASLGTVALATLGVAGLKRATDDAADFADEIEQMSLRANLSTDSVQELQHVTAIAGGSFADVETAIKSMTLRLKGAEEGSDKQAAAFVRLGIETEKSKGKLKDIETLFFESIEALQGMEEGTEKQIAAQALFGKSASNLNPILNLTREEFEGLLDDAENLGLVLDQQTITSLADYKDSIETVEKQFRLARYEIAKEFLPVLEQGLIPLIQTFVIPLMQGAADKVNNFTTALFDSSIYGDKFRGVIAGNVAGMITFGTRLFAVGEILFGIAKIAASPFTQMSKAVQIVLADIKALGEAFEAVKNFDFVAANKIVAERAGLQKDELFNLGYDIGAAFEDGLNTISAGFDLLAINEEGIKNNVKKILESTATTISENKGAFTDSGEQLGVDFSDSLAGGITGNSGVVSDAVSDLVKKQQKGFLEAEKASKDYLEKVESVNLLDLFLGESVEVPIPRAYATMAESINVAIKPLVQVAGLIDVTNRGWVTLADTVDVSITPWANVADAIDITTTAYVELADAVDVLITPWAEVAEAVNVSIKPWATVSDEIDILNGVLYTFNENGVKTVKTLIEISDAVDISVEPIVEYINAFGELSNEFGGLGEESQKIVDTFTNIGRVSRGLGDLVGGEFGTLSDAIANAANQAISFVSALARGDTVGAVISGVSGVVGLFTGIGDFFTGLFDPTKEQRQSLTQGITDSIKSGIQSAWDAFRNGEISYVEMRNSIEDAIYDGFYSGASQALIDSAFEVAGLTPIIQDIARAAISGDQTALDDALAQVENFLNSPAFDRLVNAGVELGKLIPKRTSSDTASSTTDVGSSSSFIQPISAIQTGPDYGPVLKGFNNFEANTINQGRQIKELGMAVREFRAAVAAMPKSQGAFSNSAQTGMS